MTDLKHVSEVNIVCSARPPYVLSFTFTHQTLPSSQNAWAANGESLGKASRAPEVQPEKEMELASKKGGTFEGDIDSSRGCSPPLLLMSAAPSLL